MEENTTTTPAAGLPPLADPPPGTGALAELEKRLRESVTPLEPGNDATPFTHARATAGLQLHYESHGEAPIGESCAFSKYLGSAEQAWVRRFQVPQVWTAVEMGWITEPGLVFLQNRHGMQQAAQPSPEEKAEIAAGGILYLAAIGKPVDGFDSMIVRPGCGTVFEMFGYARLWVKALRPGVRANVLILPR